MSYSIDSQFSAFGSKDITFNIVKAPFKSRFYYYLRFVIYCQIVAYGDFWLSNTAICTLIYIQTSVWTWIKCICAKPRLK